MGKLRTSSSSSASKSYDAAGKRAWRMLRLALLWARKGSILKARLMSELRHGAKYIKSLNQHHHHEHSSIGMIRYGERELSFEDTPVIHLRSSRHTSLRFIMPCIKPDVVDFDYDFGDDGYDHCHVGCSDNFLENKAGRDHYDDEEDIIKNEQMMNTIIIKDEEEKEIDAKAEEFITKFYQQMKLQREISFQQRLNTNIQVL